MSSDKITLVGLFLFACAATVLCQQQPGYLPPKKGYNYEPPKIPFPDTQQETKVPFPRPPSPPPAPRPSYNPPPTHDEHDHHHHEPGMPFEFKYAVHEPDYNNEYNHQAVSDGDVTRGEYRVQLPDGRLQIVRYTADWKNGFNAEVTYEGEARYPDQPQGQASNPSPGYGSAPSTGYKY